MTHDTQRPPFLMRKVMVPHWLLVVLLGFYLVTFIVLMITTPLLFLATATIGFTITVLVGLMREEGAGQEAKEPMNLWDSLRTYRMWWLIVQCTGCSLVLLDLVGVLNL